MSLPLLKAEPLTAQEVNDYGTGHVNVNFPSDWLGYQTAGSEGYGRMQYYSSQSCGYNGSEWVSDGCITDYEQSEVKYVVDAWKAAQAPTALDARLITIQEINNNFELEEFDCCGGCGACVVNRPNASWMYSSRYGYWTMSQYNNSSSGVWRVGNTGGLGESNVYGDSAGSSSHLAVRPVIVLPKSALNS